MGLGQGNMPYLSAIQFIMYLMDIYSCLLLAGPIFYLLVFDVSYGICCIPAVGQMGA
jgi:hypothetical protein